MIYPYIGVFLVSMMLFGCQPATVDEHPISINTHSATKHSHIVITDTSIHLSKTDVIGVKSELYQPSFRLEGTLDPIKQGVIYLPKSASLQQINFKIGDKVAIGDTVGVFFEYIQQPNALNDTDTSNNTNDTKNTPKSPRNTQTSNDTTVINTTVETTDTANHLDTPTAHTLPVYPKSVVSGRVERLLVHTKDKVYPKNTPIMTLADDSQMVVVSSISVNFKEHLRIGSTINFSTKDGRTFYGQIQSIQPTKDTLTVNILIKPKQIKHANLTLGESVSGYIEYDQLKVGALTPAFTVLDKQLQPIDPKIFSQPPHKPATPTQGFIWTVQQNGRLTLSPVWLIEYRPNSQQYLIDGVSLTGLIVLANPPKSAHNKQVILQ